MPHDYYFGFLNLQVTGESQVVRGIASRIAEWRANFGGLFK